MSALYLLVRVAGERVALPAAAIESVVEFEAVTTVPGVAPHVIGLAALRSRVVTVIDVCCAIGLPAARRDSCFEAAIVTLDGQCYGLAVEAVDDVVTAPLPLPLHSPLTGGWSNGATGLIDHEGALLLLLDPHALIAPRAALAA